YTSPSSRLCTLSLHDALPISIALSIPFTYGNILRILARRSFFIKHTVVIEAIQSINHMVFDKTGTLTAADRSAVSFHPYEGRLRSEEHTSELQSRDILVCRLL